MRALPVLVVGVLASTGGGMALAGPDLGPLVKAIPVCDAARTYCFAIRVHVPVDDQGAPIATAEWIAGQLAAANQHFERISVGFQVAGIEPLPASVARIEDRKERDSLAPRMKAGMIDFFVTGHLDDVDIEGAMVYGVTWRKRGTDRKFVVVSTQAWERTLAHELGHFFGLPHSTYAISIMNKTERTEPPHEQRTFADEEFAKMGPRAKAMVRAKTLVNHRAK